MKIIEIRIHQIESPLLAASRSSLRFSTPSGHHLQARKVGRRIQLNSPLGGHTAAPSVFAIRVDGTRRKPHAVTVVVVLATERNKLD